MSKRRYFALFLTLLLAVLALSACGSGSAEGDSAEPQYISAAQLKDRIENGDSLLFLDIQSADDAKHFTVGTEQIAVKGEPLETEGQKQAVKGNEARLTGSAPIILVTSDGGDAALTLRDMLVADGIKAERIMILEGGMAAWTYPDYI
jgi:hypothetical protein